MDTGAWHDSIKRKYDMAYSEGRLIGRVESLLKFVRNLEEKPIPDKEELIGIIFEEQPGYYDEIREIIHKYPNYEQEHLAKKIIFESTWLPYTISMDRG